MAASGASSYWLDIGNSVGKGDIYASAVAGTSDSVSGLPCDGRTLYLQLWTQVSGTWLNPNRYTVTACGGTLSPAPGSTLPYPSATFRWNAVSGADEYWLDVGSSVGIGDYSGLATTGTSMTVNSLPCDGRTVYVQLWVHSSGSWGTPNRYTYTASTGCSALSAPADNTTFTSNAVTFTWSVVPGADQYWLDVGDFIGQGDLFGSATAGTSFNVGVPCDGRPLYAQLWTHTGGAWKNPGRYQFKAWGVCGALTTPAPWSTLAGTTVTFGWTAGTGVTAYWLDVGTSVGQGNIFGGNVGTGLSKTVSGIPANGAPIYVQLWSLIGGNWYLNRYTYTAFP